MDKEQDRLGVPEIKQPMVLHEAIRRYGERPQVDVAIEEMSELTKALLKYRRTDYTVRDASYEETAESIRARRQARENIHEEIADVYIMLSQLLIIYGCSPEVQEQVDKKLDRLRQRLETKKRTAAYADGDTLAPAT